MTDSKQSYMETEMRHFTIPNRTLYNEGSVKGVLTTCHLSDVLEKLKQSADKSDPKDLILPLSRVQVSFLNGQMEAREISAEGETIGPRLLLTDVGANQLQQRVLPGHFFKGLRQLAMMDAAGAEIATRAWRKFASQQTMNDFRIRTTKMKLHGEVYRVVRSVVSMEYAVYSNIKFVEDILQHAGDYANLPVLNWWLTDSGMRIRFAAVDDPTYGLMHFDTSATSHAPLAMVEIWNSEVAQRKVGLRGGMYKLICGNGMCHWSAASEQTWIHRGDADRIQRGVSNAFQAVLRTATEVCDAYSSASDVSVKNPSVWLTQQLTKEKVPEKTITDMVKALRDPTTTPGNTLASVIDAITLVAHSTKDMDKQEEFESVAARILNYGLTVANGNGGEIK